MDSANDDAKGGGFRRIEVLTDPGHREFIELARKKTAPVAAKALARIYALEAEVRGQSSAERRGARQARSRPLVEDLFAWLGQQVVRLPGGSPTAGAIRYALNHRKGLVRLLDDGRIEPDNTVERATRPVVLSRKNALLASGDDGAAAGSPRPPRGNLQAERRRSAAPRRGRVVLTQLLANLLGG